MKPIPALGLLVLMSISDICHSSPTALTDFPKVPAENPPYLLVLIDDIKVKGELPQAPECKDAGVICMDPPPFWFTAHVLKAYFGKTPDNEISIATTSHYGSVHVERWEGPALVALVEGDTGFVMLRYAMHEPVEGKSGKMYVLSTDPEAPFWFPCVAAQVLRPISPDDLLNAKPYIRQKSDIYESDLDQYAKVQDGYFPKRAIELSELSALLKAQEKKRPIGYCDRFE